MPGFGVSGGAIANLSAPTCGICASGTYSSGFKAGGQACAACPKPATFSGQMVSRAGISTPEDCYGEFTTDATDPDNTQAWDVIPMAVGFTLVHQPGLGSMEDCQNACTPGTGCQVRARHALGAGARQGCCGCTQGSGGRPSLACSRVLVVACRVTWPSHVLPPTLPSVQYFAFYSSGGPLNSSSVSVDGCYMRIVNGAIPALNGAAAPVDGWDRPASPLVAFEIRDGTYVVYPAVPNEVIGETLASYGAANSLITAKAHCDADRACVGMQSTATGWALFGAAKREGVMGKIRVVGENIQPWVPLPTGM